MSIRFELSGEFTRWKQRLGARNATSTGMKPEESQAHPRLLVAANYRPTGMKPVEAKAQGNMLHSVAQESLTLDTSVEHFAAGGFDCIPRAKDGGLWPVVEDNSPLPSNPV